MNILVVLVPAALLLGALGLAAFFWCLRSDQFEDLEGASLRILGPDRAEPPAGRNPDSGSGARGKTRSDDPPDHAGS